MHPKRLTPRTLILLAGGLLALAAGRVQAAPEDKLPPAAERQVEFVDDVVPILHEHCASCHAGPNRKGGFSINTRESLLKGGESGPAAVPGKSAESRLIELVAAVDPLFVMPKEGEKLTDRQVGLLRAWIDQGVPWDEGFRFGGASDADVRLRPRRPEVPGGDAANPVDRFLQPYFEEHGVEPGAVVSDRRFARRAYLDLIGLLPPPERLDAFAADDRSDKRERLVQRLLNDRRDYAIHWLTFWNDALRNAYRGTGFIDGGRKQITGWLFEALYRNKPYDEFVHELISPVSGSEGFVKGIKWRGVVNASQHPAMQAAQNTAQVFLGTNLKCASCHDSFVNQWKLTDAYALANVFSQQPLEVHRCNKPLGKMVDPAFLFPQLGSIDADAPREKRLEQLADIMTDPENGRLTRTMVNRLWARFFGRGLVATVDEIDGPCWNRDLLDWLAVDLREHGYDLKHTMELIGTSRAYQLPAVDPLASGEEYVFRGPRVRRMTAEQFIDAVSRVTGVWQDVTNGMKQKDRRGQGGQLFTIKRIAGEVDEDRTRAALADADPLMRALGRPNREQVVTSRDSQATLLQALELTNGETLDAMLRQGAANWLNRDVQDSQQLIHAIYRKALGRAPTAKEVSVGRDLVGSPPTRRGVADLLWTIVMLPNFQLIE